MSIRSAFVDFLSVLFALALLAFALLAGPTFYERHVAPSYCIDRPLTGWLLLRILLAIVAIVLVLVVRPRLARAVARTPAREMVITAAGVAVALVAALAVGELLLRRARWDDQLGGQNMAALETDPRLGWRNVADRTTPFGSSAPPATYATDGNGDRIRSAAEPFDPTAPTLVVAGESIAFGHDLAWDDTFGALVGRELGLAVVNLGVAAYGTDQIYLRLLDSLPRLVAPRLVVIVFVPLEIRRNVSPGRPHFDLDDAGRLVPIPAATGLGSLRLGRLFWDEPLHGRHALDVTRALLVAVDRAVRARGGRPLFLVTNYGPACRDPEPTMQTELFAGLAHVRVDLGDADVVSPREDPHPNVVGARKIAAAIVSFARRP